MLCMACKTCAFRKKVQSYSRYQPQQAVYLDYNSTTPPDLRTLSVYENACRNNWGNQSSLHGIGQTSFDSLNESRNKIGKYLNFSNNKNIYFANSTYNALVSNLRLLLVNEKITRIITTAIEHEAVFKAVDMFEKTLCEIIILPVDISGKISHEEFDKCTEGQRAVFIYSPVNHETGSIQDYKKIYTIACQNGTFVIMDAVQAVCRINAKELHPYSHSFILSSHKIYGLKGSVLLYIDYLDKSVEQEELFSGTIDTPSIEAFSETLRNYSDRIDEDIQQYIILTEELYRILDNSGIHYKRESPEGSAPGIVNISLIGKDIDMEELFAFFLKEKICLSRFSACTGKIEGPSQILEAMGVSGSRSSQSLRITMGRQSRRNDFFRFTAILKKFLLNR